MKAATIVGAGVAGLACAAALAQRGLAVDIYERAPSLDPVGAGLQISPNGAAVLRALGIAPPGLPSQAVLLRDGLTGRRVLRMDLPGGFFLAHRAELIAALADAARAAGAKLHLGQEICGQEICGQENCDPPAGLVIAADGGRSRLRARLCGPEAPEFSGQTAWRAVIHDPQAPPVAEVHMGPGRHLVTYPLSGGRRNIVAVQERADWAEEGWHHTGDPAELRAGFADFAPDLRRMLDQVEQVMLWGLFLRPVARRFHEGALVLVGDAAHPTLPFLAQGANLALEDALVLAACLAARPDGAPLGEALRRYEARRRPRTQRAIAAANGNAWNYHLPRGPTRLAAHTALRLVDRLAPGRMLRRFDWLYGHDVTADRALFAP